MKILFVLTPSYNPQKGGVQRIVQKLGTYFNEQNNNICCFSFEMEDHVTFDFGNLITVEERGSVKNVHNVAKLIRFVEEWEPDIVLNEMPYDAEISIALNACKSRLVFKLIACLNNSLYSVKNNLNLFADTILPANISALFKNKIGNYLLLQLHKSKQKIVLKDIIDSHDAFVLPTGSEENKEELSYFVGDYQKQKVFCIPNSILDFDENTVYTKSNKLLYVGRLNDTQKRSDLLLKTWKKISVKLPKWEFDIVGDGPYLERMKKDIQKEKLERVNLMGFQNPDKFYERSEIFIMTSAFEGFPSVLLEAQSKGVIPVVFNSYPAVSWILNDKKDACLIPAYKTDAMADEIIRIAKNDNLRIQLSKNSVLNAKAYTLKLVGEKWMTLFNTLQGAS